MKCFCLKSLFALAIFVAHPLPSPAAPTVTIGQNFIGSTYNNGANSGTVGAIPPDSNGAIGPRHFVEFINGSFAVYNKTNGLNVKRVTDTHFWATAGVTISPDDVTTDPRVIYDPITQRWFASMVDANGGGSDPTFFANDFLFAVSASSDPTGVWRGFLLQADPDTGYFADFPTLGVDSNAVYLSGDFYHGSTNPVGPGLVSFPKADLLTTTPTIDNRTWFGVMDYDVRGQVLQPVSCFDGSTSGKILAVSDIGNDSDPHSNLVSFAVQNAGTPTATLTPSVFIPTLPWMVPDNDILGAPDFVAAQPDGTQTLQANDARLCSKVYAVGGVIYAVHSTELNNRIAVRWYRVRASDNLLLESGTITDPGLDFFFPSIAANAAGVVVIGFNGSGSTTLISSFAMVGQTINGVTTFGSRLLLKTGAVSYHGDDEQIGILLDQPALSRWGDYSATSVDPSDPNRFWTIQTFPSDAANDDVWSTQITELRTTPDLRLNIRRSGANVTLFWPPGFPSFHLQSNTNLANAASWTNVTQTVVTNGTEIDVALPATASRQFFRLISP
jgi:hypothetical protein